MKRSRFLLVALLSFAGLFTTAFADEAKAKLNTTPDYNTAFAEAKKDGKVVMILFTGSDWCPPCKMLHKFVLDKKEFIDFSNDNLHFVLVDINRAFAPKAKDFSAQQIALMEKYKVDGVPTIVLINPKNENTDILGGLMTKTPEELIKKIEAIQKAE